MARRAWRVKPRFWLLMMGVMLSLFSFVWSSQQELIEQKAALIEELQLTKENMEIEIAQAERQLQFSKSDEYIERIAFKGEIEFYYLFSVDGIENFPDKLHDSFKIGKNAFLLVDR